MRLSLFLKFLWTFLLAVLLLVPLLSIEFKIEERHERARQVADELAATGVGSQRIAGPVLVLPCTERYRYEYLDEKREPRTEMRERDCTLRYVADRLAIDGDIATETRARGIYRVLFYTAELTLEGAFTLPPPPAPPPEVSERTYRTAELRLGVADVRGIGSGVDLQWNAASVNFVPGSNDDLLGSGVHAPLEGLVSGAHRFRIALSLRGTRDVAFVPLARDTTVGLEAAWPHPSFFGRYLPDNRSVDASGFTANWGVSELASEAARTYLTCHAEGCAALNKEHFGVAFIDPVDVYVQSLRAVDYGFLFVGLTFLVFLLFEFLAQLKVHGVQYGLVGLALAVFFLLLFALAEHIPFAQAYLLAATACIALIAYYVRHLLGSVSRAAGFGAYLVVLYGALYGLLQSEDLALLLGALLVFAVLALTMVLTRRMDWHAVALPRATAVAPAVDGEAAATAGRSGAA